MYRGVPYTHEWCVVEELEEEPTVAASVDIGAKTVSQKFCFGGYNKGLLFNLQIQVANLILISVVLINSVVAVLYPQIKTQVPWTT